MRVASSRPISDAHRVVIQRIQDEALLSLNALDSSAARQRMREVVEISDSMFRSGRIALPDAEMLRKSVEAALRAAHEGDGAGRLRLMLRLAERLQKEQSEPNAKLH